MVLQDADWQALAVSLRLAAVTTFMLLALATPLAWWLANTHSWLKRPLSALVALPLVLPPTVLGFYLLLLLGPEGWGGQLTQALGLGTLPFTFAGLVVASLVSSLPFAVQPLQTSFESLGRRPLEVAATLRAGPWDRFWSVAVPLVRPGLLTAAVLVFAHTLGEFGVILMIGGNIPGATRVVSVAIYDHVEMLEYGRAHTLAAVMVVVSFVVLLAVQFSGRWLRVGRP